MVMAPLIFNRSFSSSRCDLNCDWWRLCFENSFRELCL